MAGSRNRKTKRSVGRGVATGRGTRTPARLLGGLERIRDSYGGNAAKRKIELLRELDRAELASPALVQRLHECLCFLRAYPDDPAVLRRVERMLARFDRRPDLRRHAEALMDTGIAGTPIYYPFFWPTARWLDRCWPRRITVDWDSVAEPARERLVRCLHLLAPFSETPALDLLDDPAPQWIERMKGARETDASFLVRRFDRLDAGEFVKESLYESFDLFLRLEPGPGTPSRTRARWARAPVTHQGGPLDRRRPDLAQAVLERPRSVRRVSPGEGARLVDLAREAMVTRARDLDAFAHADPRDVFVVDFGDGLQFAGMGMVPERRLLLESVYGFLTLRNGVPIGYVLASALFRSSEVAYNVFETYRGGESGRVFGRVLAMIRHLFGSDSFTLDPYQLGYGNEEGLRSGAWWFYYKMGFRPVDPGVRRVLRAELARMKKRPAHRSRMSTLERLASEYTFYQTGRPRTDVLGQVDLGAIGLAITRGLARSGGSDREGAVVRASEEAARLLGVRTFRGWTAGERRAWERWAPLVVVLPGVKRWAPRARRALVPVIRAKGGRSELDFAKRAGAHDQLNLALLRLARNP